MKEMKTMVNMIMKQCDNVAMAGALDATTLLVSRVTLIPTPTPICLPKSSEIGQDVALWQRDKVAASIANMTKHDNQHTKVVASKEATTISQPEAANKLKDTKVCFDVIKGQMHGTAPCLSTPDMKRRASSRWVLSLSQRLALVLKTLSVGIESVGVWPS